MPDNDRSGQVRRLARLLRRELEAEGLEVVEALENGEQVLVVGEMLVFPRRLLEGRIAAVGDPSTVDLDWLASANRSYFRNLRRFHPSLAGRPHPSPVRRPAS